MKPPQELVQYFTNEWARRKVQERVDSLPSGASRAQIGAIQSEALFTIAYDYSRLRDPNVGLLEKTSGTNHRGYSEDYICLATQRDASGTVTEMFAKDVGVSFGTRVGHLDFSQFDKSTEPHRWRTPPPPEGVEDPGHGDGEEVKKLRAQLEETRRELANARAENSAQRIALDATKAALEDARRELAKAGPARDYATGQELARQVEARWLDAGGRQSHGAMFIELLYHFTWRILDLDRRGYTDAQILEEARRRGNGSWNEDW